MVLRGKRRLTESPDGVRQCRAVLAALFPGSSRCVENQVDSMFCSACSRALAACQSRAGRNARRYPLRQFVGDSDIIYENTGNITGFGLSKLLMLKP